MGELATQSVESLHTASESLAKAHAGERSESTTRVGAPLAATLLTSIPRGDAHQQVAKKVDIPDSLFDELFADWSNAVAPQSEPIVQKVEVHLDSAPAGFCMGQILPLDSSHECSANHQNPVAALRPTPNVETRSKWGALDDVDDIFVDLNSIDFTMR